jgi:hypothetical protein
MRFTRGDAEPIRGSKYALQAQEIAEANSDDIKAIIDEYMLFLTIGELLERASAERGIDVRELARLLNINHARIKQREVARRGRPNNAEVQSLVRQAMTLAYRLRIVFEPEDSGRTLEMNLG